VEELRFLVYKLKTKTNYIIFYWVTAIAVTLFLGCKDASGDIQRFNQKSDGPSSEGEGIVLRYTDSGKVIATLITPYMKDFGLEPYPYQEFPDGVDVTFVDEDGRENFVTADYAKHYKVTGLIDLRQNVVITLSDSTKVTTDKLFWDQKNKWIFTDKAYTVRFPDDDSFNNGVGFESSEDFKNFLSLNNQSRMFVQDKQETAQRDSVQ